MIQRPTEGRYAQVQALFDHGRLIAAAISEQLATGAGGSAATRLRRAERSDPPSLIPVAVALGSVLADPARVASLAGNTIADYAVPPSAIEQVESALHA